MKPGPQTWGLKFRVPLSAEHYTPSGTLGMDPIFLRKFLVFRICQALLGGVVDWGCEVHGPRLRKDLISTRRKAYHYQCGNVFGGSSRPNMLSFWRHSAEEV